MYDWRKTQVFIAFLFLILALAAPPAKGETALKSEGKSLDTYRKLLDSPLLFVKHHPYYAGHIYDDYLTWHPGGGIYVIENPWDPPQEHRVRTIIDADSPNSLGAGVYRDPDLSWDAKRVLFAYKGEENGDTSIYEIGIDGKNLRRLTTPGTDCNQADPVRALGKGRHDITPAYLPDGRIVFTSTRPAGRVPCFNSEVDVLHVMNGDGSDIHAISVNNVNEFDPVPLPDGRILYGRWEYVDKTALYMQSLWTIFPDGTNETALFANNLARPTAVLDPRPVVGSNKVVASLTPHNGQAVGAIAMIDPRLGKNNLAAITNFTPKYPTEMDQGLRQGPNDPWPLNEEVIIIANNAPERGKHGVLEFVDKWGNSEFLHSEEDISCYAPIVVKPRPVPPVVATIAERSNAPGQFLVQNVYEGLTGVKQGDVKWLRVVEETTRISGIPGGGRWWNQAFLVSWQGAYIVKNILGVVPVHEDGSAYMQVPSGMALYLEALDSEGREVQRMRTFVQAAPGVTRSCIGCHEHRMTTPRNGKRPQALQQPAAHPQEEIWGSGFVDYATMVQPILDRNCVSCHGGEKGFAGGLDLSGGWTWAFNISYETLLKNTLVGFLNCVNENRRTSDILPPYTLGSGAAPLTEILLSGHDGRIPNLTQRDRKLIQAWMDTNSNYYGTWNWTEQATCEPVLKAGAQLAAVMDEAGCVKCHPASVGNDWVNLRDPQMSRILRAPLSADGAGYGEAMCRDRKARKVLPLVTQRDQPPDVTRPARVMPADESGEAIVSFVSADVAAYKKMYQIIRAARLETLAAPRVDMPGADIIPGRVRRFSPVPLPPEMPALRARCVDGETRLTWRRESSMIGLLFEVYRGDTVDFTPGQSTLLGVTSMFQMTDRSASPGKHYYALVALSGDERSTPVLASVQVVQAPAPPAPVGLWSRAFSGGVDLTWEAVDLPGAMYNIYRADSVNGQYEQVNIAPLSIAYFRDMPDPALGPYSYHVETMARSGRLSFANATACVIPLPMQMTPVFDASFEKDPVALAHPLEFDKDQTLRLEGKLLAKATVQDGALDLREGGHVVFPKRPEFDLSNQFTVECQVNLSSGGDMPVVLSCGAFNQQGWFLQRIQGKWRWHVGGNSCDGGEAPVGRWVHIVAVFDGQVAHLFEDGKEVASLPCSPTSATWNGPLFIGQYGPAPGKAYQVDGRIKNVRIYQRALGNVEIAKEK